MGLYKPRRIWTFYICLLNHFNPRGWQCWSKMLFQSTRLYKPRPAIQGCNWLWSNFNPRGCISLDNSLGKIKPLHHPFQSTRLYKPRPGSIGSFCISELFQSTRLYKPRPNSSPPLAADFNFNPRGCISLDILIGIRVLEPSYFNPRGCISLDDKKTGAISRKHIISIHEAV